MPQLERMIQNLRRFADEFITLNDSERAAIMEEALNWAQHTAIMSTLASVRDDLEDRTTSIPATSEVDRVLPAQIPEHIHDALLQYFLGYPVGVHTVKNVGTGETRIAGLSAKCIISPNQIYQVIQRMCRPAETLPDKANPGDIDA